VVKIDRISVECKWCIVSEGWEISTAKIHPNALTGFHLIATTKPLTLGGIKWQLWPAYLLGRGCGMTRILAREDEVSGPSQLE
jgi:hypothetical protein